MLEVLEEIGEPPHILCLLCSKKLSQENFIAHIQSIPHMLNFVVSL